MVDWTKFYNKKNLLGSTLVLVLAFVILNNKYYNKHSKVITLTKSVEDETGLFKFQIDSLSNAKWRCSEIKHENNNYIDTLAYLLSDSNKKYLLVMVEHATPPTIGNLDLCELGDALLKKGINKESEIYLNGCNTGLTPNIGKSIKFINNTCKKSAAQILSNILHCTVYGSCGFLKGNFAMNNEVCTVNDGISNNTYPNIRDAEGRKVWIKFEPEEKNTCNCEDKIVNIDSSQFSSIFYNSIPMSLREVKLSMFSDYKLRYNDSTYELYNNGKYLYNLNSNRLFLIRNGD